MLTGALETLGCYPGSHGMRNPAGPLERGANLSSAISHCLSSGANSSSTEHYLHKLTHSFGNGVVLT